MSNDYENNGYGTSGGSEPENSSSYNPATGNASYSSDNTGNTGTGPENTNTASESGNTANGGGANNTTYHYSYTSANRPGGNQNNVNYYTPPQQPYNTDSDKEKKNKKAVQYDQFGNPVKVKKSKAPIIIAVVIAICVIAAVIGIVVSVTGGSSSGEDQNQNSGSSAQVQTQDAGEVAQTDGDGNYTVAGIAKNFIDSCVGITVYSESSAYSDFFGYGYGNEPQSSGGEQTVSSEGSGIIMLEDGNYTYILTCAHVISDGSSFKVTLNNGDEYDAVMVGYDNQTDIGVLRINATGLKVAEFADSDSTTVGEQVVAIGCPGGIEFMNSVTSGYISALARPVSSSIGYDQECIQTDAAINPGNSGGALFNMQGQVIGVNSSKIASTEYEGMGFAVPSNTAIATANSLIKVGYVEGRAQIGITYTSLENYSNANAIISALNELGYEDAKGTMVINEVSADSDLADKNVRQYDMIVAVNGTTLTDTDIMTSTLSDCSPGDTIKLTIARIENNKINTFDVDCTLIESKGNN